MRATLPSRSQDLSWRVFLWFFSNRQLLLLGFFVFFGYFLGAQISLAFQIPASSISIIWIPNSILLAALLLSPVRLWWIIYAAVFPAHYILQAQYSASVWIILWTYLAKCALSFTTAIVIRKFSGARFKFDNLERVALYLLAVGIATVVTAFAERGFPDLQMGLIFLSIVPLILSGQIGESRYPTTLVQENESPNDFSKLDGQLIESEPMNSSILKVLPDLAFLIREDGTYLDYHARKVSELYVPPEQFLGKNVREIMPPQIADQIFGYFKAAKETGATQCFEYSLEMNGSENIFECRIVQSGDDKFLSIVRDVTEQRKTQKALDETRQMFEAQYRNLPVPSYIWQKSGDDFILIDYNHAANAVKKGKAANLLGIKAGDEYRDFPVIFEGFNRCFNEKRTVELEMPYQPSPNTAEKYVFLTYVSIPPDMVMFHIQDLTERKRTLDELEAKFDELQTAREEIASQNEALKLSRAEIEAEKQRYWELFDFAPDGYLVTDCKGGILEANEAAAELLGAKKRLLKGFSITTFVSFEDKEVFQKLLAKMQIQKTVHEIEVSLVANRHKFYAAIKVAPVISDGELNLRWILRDISVQRSIQAKLRKSEELYRNVVETQTELICRFLPDTTLTFVNDAYARYFGKSRDKLLGRKFVEVIPKDTRPMVKTFIQSLIEKRGTSQLEHQVILADGSIGWQQWTNHVIEDEQGNILELQGIGRDITEEKRAVESLRESEERFYSFMNNSPVTAWITDEDGRFLYINSAFSKTIKLPDGDIIGKTLYDVFPIDSAQKYHLLIEAVLEAGAPDKTVVEAARLNNTIGTFLSYRFPLTSTMEGKRLVGGFAIDITEQHLIEKALSESEEKYRRIVETMVEGIWITDKEMRISFANQQLADKLGYQLEELLGRIIFDFYDKETQLLAPQIIERRRNGIREQYDAKLRRKDGSYLWVIVSATPYYDVNGEFAGSLAMILDITERKQAEDNLREREELLRGLVQNIPDGAIGILDKDLNYVMAEGQELERLNLSGKLMKGKHISELFPKKLVDFSLPFFKRAFKGEEVWFELPASERCYQMCALPLRDTNEDIYSILVVARNITEYKQKEDKLRRLSARLLTIQDEERRRLARELHDETAQNIAVLGINLSAIKKTLSPDNDKALNLLRDSESLVMRSLREVRTLSYLLHPPMLDEGGFVSALKWFINGFATRSGIEVTFTQNEEVGRLPSDIETALYRIVQEGLNNIHRHSGSQTAGIELIKEPDKIILRVKDKGCGLPEDVPDLTENDIRLLGVGIPGMRERLRLLGGHLEIVSDKKGTTLTAIVPLEVNAHD